VIHTFRRVLPRAAPTLLDSDSEFKVPSGSLLGWIAAFQTSGSGGADIVSGSAALTSGSGALPSFLLLCLAKTMVLQVRGRMDRRPVLVQASMPELLLPGSLPSSIAPDLLGLLRLLATCSTPSRSPVSASSPALATWQAAVTTLCTTIVSTLPGIVKAAAAASPAIAAQLPQVWLGVAALSLQRSVVPGAVDAVAATASPGAGVVDRAGAVASPASPAVAAAAPPSTASAASTASDASAALAVVAAAPTVGMHKLCENHQDGRTAAKWSCVDCGGGAVAAELRSDGAAGGALLLCEECDLYLHLPARHRTHVRNVLRLGAIEVPYCVCVLARVASRFGRVASCLLVCRPRVLLAFAPVGTSCVLRRSVVVTLRRCVDCRCRSWR
jgi:hypothetical protein